MHSPDIALSSQFETELGVVFPRKPELPFSCLTEPVQHTKNITALERSFRITRLPGIFSSQRHYSTE